MRAKRLEISAQVKFRSLTLVVYWQNLNTKGSHSQSKRKQRRGENERFYKSPKDKSKSTNTCK